MARDFDILVAIQSAMRDIKERHMIDAIYGRPDFLDDLARSSAVIRPNLTQKAPETLFGIKYIPNPMFPVETACAACEGTGEGGGEATYCPSCDGAGAHRTEGMVRNGAETILMRAVLPKKFAPRFPTDIPLHRRPATRSREIPYPVGAGQ